MVLSEASNDKPNYQYGLHSLDDNSLMKAEAELACGKPIGTQQRTWEQLRVDASTAGFYFPLNGEVSSNEGTRKSSKSRPF